MVAITFLRFAVIFVLSFVTHSTAVVVVVVVVVIVVVILIVATDVAVAINTRTTAIINLEKREESLSSREGVVVGYLKCE